MDHTRAYELHTINIHLDSFSLSCSYKTCIKTIWREKIIQLDESNFYNNVAKVKQEFRYLTCFVLLM